MELLKKIGITALIVLLVLAVLKKAKSQWPTLDSIF